ncbi:MAG: YciI family protein [Nocardioides sp.]
MSRYVVMFPADSEPEWEAENEAERQVTFDTDFEFGQLLERRGGAVTGGAGLTHSDQARTLKRGPNATALVTDGPYTESAEQLSGFYLVTCDDYDALVECAQILTQVHPVVEIRPVQEY